MNDRENIDYEQLDEKFDSGADLLTDAYNTVRRKCKETEAELLKEQAKSVEYLHNLDQTRKELAAVKEELAAEKKTNSILTNLTSHLQKQLSEKKNEPRFTEVLDMVLPVVKPILEKCESVTPDKLEEFQKKNLPMHREVLSYNLEILGISLDYHNPGDPISDFDDTIEVVAQYTNDKTLHSTTYKSISWGYSLIATGAIIKKEKVCVWIYKEDDSNGSAAAETGEETAESSEKLTEAATESIGTAYGEAAVTEEARTVAEAVAEDTVADVEEPTEEENAVREDEPTENESVAPSEELTAEQENEECREEHSAAREDNGESASRPLAEV